MDERGSARGAKGASSSRLPVRKGCLIALAQDWFLQTVPHAMQFFQHRTALAYRSDPSLHSLLDLLNRQLRAYGKLYNKEERRADLSRPIFEYCWAVLTEAGRAPHLISEDLSSVFPTKIVVQAIVIIRGILILWPSTEFSVSSVSLLDSKRG